MTRFENFKKELLDAAKAADEPINKYHDTARKIVNIERQSFYGDENERGRLKKIREEIAGAVSLGEDNEI